MSTKYRKTVKITEKDQESLFKISKRYKLGLNVDEMMMLRNYFKSLSRDPTDIEMQAMAQAWSEHCCYKSSKFYLKNILGSLRQDYVILAMEDDAGVVSFDQEYVYVLKMESHNHPSAVDPYGGAATGVGGIIRDVLCMGAQPVALIDSLFLGDLRKKKNLGVLDETFIFDRMVAGIRDYGNRMGIPNVAGSIIFDPSYSANPLVNAGCIGIARKSDIVRSRVSRIGDLLVVAGGKTGRDGIHGVNFASRSVSKKREEDISSVQLGNPVIEEALTHAVLEATEAGILDGMKDLGGGGLSSSVGELCYAGGVSATVFLDKVPLKEEGMEPWEIWISESQERMLMAVSEENIEALSDILESWDLDYAVIGKVKEGTNLVIKFNGSTILDLDLSFMTSGPVYCRNYFIPDKTPVQIQPPEPKDLNDLLLSMLSDLNLCSREPVVRTYDSTIRGNTVMAQLDGYPSHETHTDSAIIRPVESSYAGIVIKADSKPLMISGDPYRGVLNTMSESYRNIMCSGGTPHSIVDALNFGDPEDPVIMGQLVESLKAIRDFCSEFSLPVVSGNVSLYNKGRGGNIRPSPVIMTVGIINDVRKRLRSYFTTRDNLIFIVGSDSTDLSGSVLLEKMGYEVTGAPFLNMKELLDIREKWKAALESNIILSAHDISDGGLACAISEMTFGLDIGARIDISEFSAARPINKLFAEGGNRILVEVSRDRAESFSSIFGSLCRKIGETGGNHLKISDIGVDIIDLPVDKMKEKWENGLTGLI